jgi:hypothetical protein
MFIRSADENSHYRQQRVYEKQDLQVIEVQVVIKSQSLDDRVLEAVRLIPACEYILADNSEYVICPCPEEKYPEDSKKVTFIDSLKRKAARGVEHKRACAHEEHGYGESHERIPKRAGKPARSAQLIV